MKRSAFTMIELIFVIVILGILAAVAIPKLAGVQDDALVSSEKTGIASARSGTAGIRGRMLTRPGIDQNITVTFIDGTSELVTILGVPNTLATGVSTSRFPNALSVAVGATVPSIAANEGSGEALALVLEPEGRESWKTRGTAGNITIGGPASSVVVDTSVELNTDGSWRYDAGTGIYVWQATTAY